MFGQYSRGTTRRSKSDMAEAASAATVNFGAITKSKKAGNNRLHFWTADGTQHYLLHATVIASLSGDRSLLALDNGGWATMTTHRAMSEALAAFGLEGNVYSNRGQSSAFGHSFDRTATFAVPSMKPVQVFPELLMVRATEDGGDTYAGLLVTYDGREVVSEGVHLRFRCKPERAILALRTCSEVARRNRRWCGMIRYSADRNYAADASAVILGEFSVHSGRFGRSVFVGCHEFRTVDLRVALRRLEEKYPEAKKRADKISRALKRRAKRQPVPAPSGHLSPEAEAQLTS